MPPPPTQQQSRLRVISSEEIRQRELQGSSSTQNNSRLTQPRRKPQPNIDIRKTKEYKTASRRWVSTIVALPILFYTSWELYERTYGSKVQKSLVDVKRKPVDEVSSKKE